MHVPTQRLYTDQSTYLSCMYIVMYVEEEGEERQEEEVFSIFCCEMLYVCMCILFF